MHRSTIRHQISAILMKTMTQSSIYIRFSNHLSFIHSFRIHPNTNELLKNATLQHLDKFASDGLRTLCVAYKEVDTDFAMDWLVISLLTLHPELKNRATVFSALSFFQPSHPKPRKSPSKTREASSFREAS